MKLKNIIGIIIGITIIIGIYSSTSAIVFAAFYAIEKLPDSTVYSDFVVGPGKYQIDLRPGESKVVNIIVTNRLGGNKTFQIQIEDFKGTRDVNRAVVLLDNEKGPYSLRDYLKIDSKIFSIGNAERVTVPVTIKIPTDAQPGGLYGSIIISTVTAGDEKVSQDQNSAGVSSVVARIGSLLFIRVAGQVKQDLVLKDFSLKNHTTILGSAPINFQILHENNGTVHENPSGLIMVKNMFGSRVADLQVEPWFVLPDSLRVRELSWNAPFLFGRYTATAEIKKGYGDQVDISSFTFWVIPWKIIVLAFIVLVVIPGIRWVLSKLGIYFRK